MLSAFCEAIVIAGPVGSAHKLKIVNNALSMSLAAVAAEVCVLSERLEIDVKTLRALVSRGQLIMDYFKECFLF